MANHRKVNTKPNRFSTAAACAFLALVLLLLSVVSGVYAKYVVLHKFRCITPLGNERNRI